VLRLLLVITASVALALVVSSALAPAFGYQAKGRVALGNPRGAQPPITFEATCPLCKTTATQVRGHYDQPDREEYELLDKKLAVSKELWTVACPTKGCGILFAVEATPEHEDSELGPMTAPQGQLQDDEGEPGDECGPEEE
jgi:hypothetical protein